MTFITFIAGIFAGISLILALFVFFQLRLIEALNQERKLFINKSMVREGQAKIFADAPASGSTPKPPGQIRSPFQAGLGKLKEQVKILKAEENGSKLPEEIKQAILKAKEEKKEGINE